MATAKAMEITFTHGRDIRDLALLDDLDRAQLGFAAARYDGDSHPDLAPLFADGAEWSIDAWRVERDGVRLYDAWVVNGDSATFFEPGTARFAGIEVAQDSIESYGDAEPALLEALEHAFGARGTTA